ncbi:MAG: hypothetical protein J1F35_05835 [Erysipelotrichales bacterium]|nr:hypothetical protein [Erysipelotrichales bacterium]
MRPIQVLYIHDFNGSAYEETYKNIEESLKKYPKIILHTISWDLKDSSISVERLNIINYINENKIDILIGNSVGGYIISSINKPKILMNSPLDKMQLGIVGLYPDFYESYNKELWENYGPNNTEDIWICSSSKDNLFGTKSYSLVKNLFTNSNIIRNIFEDEHVLKFENIEKVIDGMFNMIKSNDKLLNRLENITEEDVHKYMKNVQNDSIIDIY